MKAVFGGLIEHVRDVAGKKFLKLVDDDEELAWLLAVFPPPALANLPEFVEE